MLKIQVLLDLKGLVGTEGSVEISMTMRINGKKSRVVQVLLC